MTTGRRLMPVNQFIRLTSTQLFSLAPQLREIQKECIPKIQLRTWTSLCLTKPFVPRLDPSYKSEKYNSAFILDIK